MNKKHHISTFLLVGLVLIVLLVIALVAGVVVKLTSLSAKQTTTSLEGYAAELGKVVAFNEKNAYLYGKEPVYTYGFTTKADHPCYNNYNLLAYVHYADVTYSNVNDEQSLSSQGWVKEPDTVFYQKKTNQGYVCAKLEPIAHTLVITDKPSTDNYAGLLFETVKN